MADGRIVLRVELSVSVAEQICMAIRDERDVTVPIETVGEIYALAGAAVAEALHRPPHAVTTRGGEFATDEGAALLKRKLPLALDIVSQVAELTLRRLDGTDATTETVTLTAEEPSAPT